MNEWHEAMILTYAMIKTFMAIIGVGLGMASVIYAVYLAIEEIGPEDLKNALYDAS